MKKQIHDIREFEHAIFGKLTIKKGQRRLTVNVFKFHGENEPWRYQDSNKEVKL